MSEIVYLKCDQVGCQALVPQIDAEELMWSKDDMDSDICPDCKRAADEMEKNSVTVADLEAFGKIVSEEADKALAAADAAPTQVAVVGPMVKQEVFEAALELTVKELKASLKKQKKTKAFIDETIRIFRLEAAALRAP